MKKVFGFLFLVFGVISLPGCITPDPAATIGRLIGNALIAFLPAYILLRNGKKNKENNKNK